MENNTSLNVLNFADDTMLYKTFTKNTNLNDSKSFNTELSKLSCKQTQTKTLQNPKYELHQSKSGFWKKKKILM